jgi:hypothetical protein
MGKMNLSRCRRRLTLDLFLVTEWRILKLDLSVLKELGLWERYVKALTKMTQAKGVPVDWATAATVLPGGIQGHERPAAMPCKILES